MKHVLPHWYEKKLDAILDNKRRQSITIPLAILFLLYASYLSYAEEHQKVLKSNKGGCEPYEKLAEDDKTRLREAFIELHPKVFVSFYGDTSASNLARDIAISLQGAKVDATFFGSGGRLDDPLENGIEFNIRDHLHPTDLMRE